MQRFSTESLVRRWISHAAIPVVAITGLSVYPLNDITYAGVNAQDAN